LKLEFFSLVTKIEKVAKRQIFRLAFVTSQLANLNVILPKS